MRYAPWWSPQPNCLVCPRGHRRCSDERVRIGWSRRHCHVCPPVEAASGRRSHSVCVPSRKSGCTVMGTASLPADTRHSGCRLAATFPTPAFGRSRAIVSWGIFLRVCALTHTKAYYVITSRWRLGCGDNRLHRPGRRATSPRDSRWPRMTRVSLRISPFRSTGVQVCRDPGEFGSLKSSAARAVVRGSV